MRIEFDPAKRDRTLKERGVDMARAGEIFAGSTLSYAEVRRDYGESRFISIGRLDARMVVLVWTQRGSARRVISLRKANDRERAYYGARLGS